MGWGVRPNRHLDIFDIFFQLFPSSYNMSLSELRQAVGSNTPVKDPKYAILCRMIKISALCLSNNNFIVSWRLFTQTS